MAYEFTPWMLPFAGSTLVCLLLTAVVGRIADDRIGRCFVLWLLGVGLWSGTTALRLSAQTQSQELLWYSLRFLGVAAGAAGFFLLAAAYTLRSRWFQPDALAGLVVVPAITNLLAWTNGRSGLLWSVDGSEWLLVAYPSHEPWFYLHAFWSYLLVGVALYWLLTDLVQNRRELYRKQTLVLLLGFGFGVTPGFLSLAGITRITWTPIGITLAAGAMVVAVFRYQLFDVSPIARAVVVENIDSAMIVVDEENTVVDANEQAQTLLKDDIDQLVGHQIEAILAGPLAEQLPASPDGGTRQRISVRGEETTRQYEVSISEIEDATQKQIGRVFLFTDVSEQARQRRRLRKQKRELKRQNERLDKFASVISHDLRNPLGVAQLRLNLLTDEYENEHTEAIEHSLNRMETMIHDILTMARAETTVEETESIRLRELSHAAWETTETETATLDVAVPANATVEGDWSLLRTAFENLFRNAVEHGVPDTASGSGDSDRSITVRVATQRDEPGQVSMFCVEDDGQGIPPDERDDVFEFGYSTSDEGTGFGLAIVGELIEAHGWEITVTESNTGGARFEMVTEDTDEIES